MSKVFFIIYFNLEFILFGAFDLVPGVFGSLFSDDSEICVALLCVFFLPSF